MITAVYPGSFNPWHDGHDEILRQACRIFDKVIVAQGVNKEKSKANPLVLPPYWEPEYVSVCSYDTLLVDFLKGKDIQVVIKGLRNASDFEYEKTQQYWNEDLGIKIPTMYLISDREYAHYSSSAIRMLESFKKGAD